MAKFEAWIKDLHEEIVRLEFYHYESHQRKGKLDPRDFALSLIAAADPRARPSPPRFLLPPPPSPRLRSPLLL